MTHLHSLRFVFIILLVVIAVVMALVTARKED